METLIRLIEKRIEIGKRPWTGDKTSFRNKVELEDYNSKIVRKVLELYKLGELAKGESLEV